MPLPTMEQALAELTSPESAGEGAGAPTPDAPAAPPSMDEAFAELKQATDDDQREVNRFNTWRALNSEITPERASKVFLMQAAMPGADPFFVNDNLEELTKNVDRQRLLAMAQRSEIVRKGLEDAAKAPMVVDDAANLSQLEWWVTGKWENVPVTEYVPNEKGDQYFPVERQAFRMKTAPGWIRALRDAGMQQYATALALKQALGLADSEDDAELERLDREYGEKDYGAKFLPAKLVLGAAKGLPYMAGNIAVRALATAAAGGPETPAGVAAGIGSGVLFDTVQNFGPLFRRLRQLKDSEGKALLTEQEARDLSGIGSLISGGITGGMMGVPLSKIPGGKYLVGDALEQALVKRGVGELMAHTGKEYSKAMTMGIGAMVVQNAINNGAEQMALGRHGQETDWSGAMKSALVDGIVQGFEGMALLTAYHPLHTYVHEVGLSRMVDENHAKMQETLAVTKRMNLPAEVLEELVASGGKLSQGGLDTVYADRARWDDYWTGRKLDPREAAARVLGDEGKAYDESSSTKGPLEIPIEKYVARLGKTEHALALAEDVRYTPDGRTPREERAMEDRIQAKMRERAKVPADQLDPEERKVYDHFYEKARAAKASHGEADATALLVAHSFEARAQEHNQVHPEAKVTAWEIANPFLASLNIHGPEEAAASARRAAQLGQPPADGAGGKQRRRIAHDFEDLTPAHQAFVLAYEKSAPEAQHATYYLDPTTNLLHERGARDLPHDPERPYMGAITFGFKKEMNDTLGHDTTDKAFADLGVALHAKDELATKVQGDLHLPRLEGRTEEEAQAYLDKTVAELKNRFPGLPIIGKAIERRPGEPWQHTVHRITDTLGAHVEAARGRGEFPLREAKLPKDFAYQPKGEKVKREGIPQELADRYGTFDPSTLRRAGVEAYTDRAAPILNKAGWDEARKPGNAKRHVASIDLRAIAAKDKRLGHIPTDELVNFVSITMKVFGGTEFDAAHVSGDEFKAQHDDPAKLRAFMDKVVGYLAAERWVLKGEKDGVSGRWVQEGVHLAYGTAEGPNADHVADAASLPDAKKSDPHGTPDDPTAKQWHADRTRFVPDSEWEAYARGNLPGWTADPPAGRGHQLVRAGASVSGGGEGLRGAGGGQEAGPAGSRAPSEAPGEVAIPDAPGAKLKLESRGPAGERGYITASGPLGEKGRRFDIQLLKSADESTLAHETFHWMADVLHELATAEGAHEGLRGDYQKLVGFMGYGSAEERAAASRERWSLQDKEARTAAEERRLKELTAREERASHAWEQYLAEGKAPTGELAGAFSRFKLWMLRIYKAIRGAGAGENIGAVYRERFGQEVGLSDEVRRVFDRILVSDEQTRLAASTDGSQPLPAALERMTLPERAEYETAMKLRRDTAEQTLLAKLATSDRREKRAFFKEETRKVRSEVEAELDRDPAYRALHFLKTGELRGPAGAIGDMGLLRDGAGNPLKLDRAELQKRYGREATLELERQHPGIVAPKGKGGDLDGLAMHLGFSGPDDLVNSLRFKDSGRSGAPTPADLRPSREQLVAQEVKRRIQQVYGPALIDNPGRLSEEAMSAVHNEARARAVLLELKAMRRAIDPSAGPEVRMADLATYRDAAQRLVEEKTVAGVAPSYYLAAERAAAKQAFEAAAAGKLDKAYEAKDAQLLNHELYRAAVEVRRELDSKFAQLARSSRDTWRAELGKADPTYRDGHDAVLEAIGLGPDQWMADGKRQASNAFERAVAQATADVVAMDFNVEALRELVAKPRGWRDLGVDEARNVFDAVKSLRHIANRINEVKLADKTATRVETIDRMRKTLEASLPKQPASPRSQGSATVTDAVRRGFQWADGMLLDMESMAEFMDGGKSGVHHELLIDNYLAARNRKGELGKQFLAGLTEHWEKMPKELRDTRNELVDLTRELPLPDKIKQAGNIKEGPITRADMLMIALNLGAEENRQRLRDGYEWTEPQILQALQGKMSAAEWRWVQGVHDSLEGLYPLLAEVHEADTGLKPGKVKATPYTVLTTDGERVEMKGGYFPLIYDRRASEVGFKQEEAAVAQVMSPGYITPVVSKGHTKQRVEHFEGALKLDWSVVPSHVAQVIHDIAFRQYVRQTAGVLMQPEVKGLLKSHLGEERSNQILPWLKSVASAQAEAVPAEMSWWNKATSWTRNRMAVQALGHSLTNFAADMTNPALAAASGEVSVAHMTAAMVKFTTSPLAQRQFALEHSSELRYRAEHMSAHLRTELERMGNYNVNPTLRAIRDTAFSLMEASDKLTATPVWLGKYSQELQAGLAEHGDQVRAHTEAVRLADATIRKLFPPSDAAEGPALLRNRQGLGSLLMFYGFFNKVYQAQRGLIHESWITWHDQEATVGDKLGSTAAAAGRILAMAMVTGVLAEALAGKGPDKKKGDDWEKWLFRKVLSAPFSSLPFAGPAVEQALGGQKVSIRQAPMLSFAQDTYNKLGGLIQASLGNKEFNADRVGDLAELILGLGLNVPMRQERRTLQGLAHIAQDPPGDLAELGSAAADLMYGHRPKGNENIGDLAGELVR